MRFSKLPLALAALGALPLSLASADDRIDQILEEVRALRADVNRLESRIEQLEGEVEETAALPEGPTPATTAAPNPEEGEKNQWFDKMRIELKKAEARASGAWTEPEPWDQVREGMEKEALIALLGEPTRRKFSIRKDTDEILIYEGDLMGSGKPVYGEVRIYKGEVARWEKPDLPAN